MKKANVITFYSRLRDADPAPVGELHYVNPYTLLVAVALSAQATDVVVNKATRPLFAKVKTPEAMVKLGLDGLKAYIKTIGLYNTKAKNVIALSQLLIERQATADIARVRGSSDGWTHGCPVAHGSEARAPP